MTPTPGRSSSRDKVLDAAAGLVARHGVHHLTIEATAAAAGLTKAGLIYHFKTRTDLLAALVERLAGELDAQAHGAAPSTLQGKIGHVADFTFEMPEDQKRLLTNMLAAVSMEPQLLPAAQALFARGYEGLGDGPGASLARLLSAALDGLLLLDLLQLHTFSPEQRAAMRSEIAALARQLP